MVQPCGLWSSLPRAFRSLARAILTLGIIGCHAEPAPSPAPTVTLTEGGNTYAMPSFDAHAAQLYDAEGPSVSSHPTVLCAYWTKVATDVARRSDGLKAWAAAKKDPLCQAAAARDAEDAQREKEQTAIRRQREAEKEAEDQRRLRERFDAEIQAGRCDDKHVQHLRGVLQQSGQIWESGSSRDPNIWDAVSHKFVVASDKAETFEMNLVIGGEVHIFVLGYSRQHLEVADAQGYRIKNESAYVGALSEVFHLKTNGVQFPAHAGDRVTPSITGRGCVLVFAVRRN